MEQDQTSCTLVIEPRAYDLLAISDDPLAPLAAPELWTQLLARLIPTDEWLTWNPRTPSSC